MKRFKLDEQSVVVITGASSGIGRAAALAFADRRACLVLAGRSLEALQTVARDCEERGARLLAVETDTGDAGAMARLALAASEAFGGRIDVWVNNAGVAAFGPFTQTPVEAHDQVIRTNLMGYIHGAHAAMPYFLAQGSGRLINVISMAAWAPTPLASSYSASKFGNRGFSEALRVELAGLSGIRICDLFPAFVDTPMLEHVANYSERSLAAVPLVVRTEEVARRMVALVERPRDSTSVGITVPIMVMFHSSFPRLFRWSAGRATKLYLAMRPKASRADGILYAASGEPADTSGGLRSPAGRALALAGFTGLAFGVAWAMRRNRG